MLGVETKNPSGGEANQLIKGVKTPQLPPSHEGAESAKGGCTPHKQGSDENSPMQRIDAESFYQGEK